MRMKTRLVVVRRSVLPEGLESELSCLAKEVQSPFREREAKGFLGASAWSVVLPRTVRLVNLGDGVCGMTAQQRNKGET